MKKLFTFSAIFLISILAYTLYTTDFQTPEIPQPETISETGDIEVYFCPQEDCEGILASQIKQAGTADCAFFDLDLPKVISALKNTNYRLVIDEDNIKELEGTGLNYVTASKGFQLMHNKFCILDNKTIITGSMNPTDRGAYSNNNNLLVIESEALAQNYQWEFEELYSGKFGSGALNNNSEILFNGFLLENYFCPEDMCASEIIKELKNAKSEIRFMAFSFTHHKIADTIIDAKERGVSVKGVFEKGQKSKWSVYEKLFNNSIGVRVDTNKANMHHKVFIIDGETVVTGSMNPTKNGDENNDENVLIIHDQKIARKFLEEFERVWSGY